MSEIWKKQSFWENVKRTLATFSGPTVVGLHEFGAADGWVITAGIVSLLGGVLSIWMEDKDKDGYTDLFEDEA
jgi:hypothetical protein